MIRTARTLKGKVMGETGKDGADLPGRTELKDREGGGGRKIEKGMEMMTDQMAAGLVAAGFNRNQLPRFVLGAGLGAVP